MKRIILCLFIIYSYSLFSQTKGLSSDTKDFFQQAKEQAVGKEQMLNKESFPVGNPVSPDFYIVGPGDVLTLQALPLFPVEQLLSVSPENKIIIPRIGDVDLSGKTLAAAYDTIAKIIRARIPDAIVSLALRQPRIVLVHIYGSVTTPGIFTLPASYRVSTAIKIANQYKISNETSIEQVPALLKIQDKIKQSETYYSETGLAQNSVYSERNIIIMQNNGVSITADFEKATILKQWEYDPYLKEGDEIFVPFESDNFPAISISGAVLRPTSIVYKNGDKASFLLKAGYGFKEDANLKDIVLFDPINDSKTILKVDKSMNLLSTDVDLSPGSMIIVGEQKPILPVKHGVVSVRGNVGSPGIYIIVPNKTRLKDAINMAGGFTQDAYLPLAKIIRRENLDLSPNDAKREVGQLFQYSDLTLEDTTRYNLHMELRNPIVSCNFVDCFEHNSEKDNPLLADGDNIIIPTKPLRVYVFGQVNEPGYVEFSENKTMEWYIAKAGGYAPSAEKGRARIIRGRNKVWIEGNDEVLVYAGDQIYVPRPPDVPKSLEIQNYGVVASMIASVAVMISVLYNILKY